MPEASSDQPTHTIWLQIFLFSSFKYVSRGFDQFKGRFSSWQAASYFRSRVFSSWKIQESPVDGANVGRCAWEVISCAVVAWRPHRGGSVPPVFTERREVPLVALNLCVTMRCDLGERDPVPTWILLYTISSCGSS